MKKKQENRNIIESEIIDKQLIIKPIKQLRYANAGDFKPFYNTLVKYDGIIKLSVDLRNQTIYDTYLIVFLNKLRKFSETNEIDFELVNISSHIQQVINLLIISKNNQLTETKKSSSRRFTEYIGNRIIHIFEDVHSFISFFGEVVIKLVTLIFKPSRMRWKDMPGHFTQSGVMALPITALIVFLLGLITGYQGALQLKQFGADSFIADLIGISLTRELSPLMVAILVAGRSGSAFAAEIGTMKVSEEIDSLSTMGFDVYEFLVLPRIISVTLAMPILVIFCNVVGIFGGLIAALSTLDVTTSGYILRLESALSLWDIGTGLIKSVIFGGLIATLGCYKGLNVSGGADAVGKFTTSSVVAGVFMIILTDAVFTFIFQALGI